jgi:hypothetical protein
MPSRDTPDIIDLRQRVHDLEEAVYILQHRNESLEFHLETQLSLTDKLTQENQHL